MPVKKKAAPRKKAADSPVPETTASGSRSSGKTFMRIRRMNNKFSCNRYFFGSRQAIQTWEAFECPENMIDTHLKTNKVEIVPESMVGNVNEHGTYDLNEKEEIIEIMSSDEGREPRKE